VHPEFPSHRTPFATEAMRFRPIDCVRRRARFLLFPVSLVLFASISLFAQDRTIYISKHYLDIPVDRASENARVSDKD
jgi:hypothetical protein